MEVGRRGFGHAERVWRILRVGIEGLRGEGGGDVGLDMMLVRGEEVRARVFCICVRCCKCLGIDGSI